MNLNFFDGMFGEMSMNYYSPYRRPDLLLNLSVYSNELSIVTFHASKYDMGISPLPQLIDGDHHCFYRTYEHADYNRHDLNNKLEVGK